MSSRRADSKHERLRALGYEKAIKDEEMGDFIAEILMPVKTVKEFRNGKKRESEMKLYPSYLFVRARLFDEDANLLEAPWNLLRGIDGVIGLIGGQTPVPLRADEIRDEAGHGRVPAVVL